MQVGKLVRKIGPLVAVAAATALAGCDGMDVTFNGEDGVALADLDMSGEAPTGVALGGPDNVVITAGETFTIEVEGSDEAADRLRFVNEDGTLAIGRESNSWNDGDDLATVNITLPMVSTIALGGSGAIMSEMLSGDADVVVGGSGTVTVTGVDAGTLTLAMGGSGTATLSGRADTLEMAIGGSGTAALTDLEAGDAEVSIGGSGDATFMSDGNVEANIAGSGTVRVIGDATCTANTFGSGDLVCEPRAAEAETVSEES